MSTRHSWVLARLVLATILMLCLSVALWLARPAQTPAPPVVVLAGAVAAAATTPVTASASALSRSDLQAATALVVAAKPSAAATAAAAKAPDAVWDLCGLGRVAKPPGTAASGGDPWHDLPRHLLAEPSEKAMGQLVAELDAGDARRRAAAVMLRGFDAQGVEVPKALSQLAASSLDPTIARWLLQRCGAQHACSDADLRLWTELEPDNLAAWLERVARNPELKPEVLARAAGLTRFDTHDGRLVQAVLIAMPMNTQPYVQMNILAAAVGVEAAFSHPPAMPLTQHCRDAATAGGALREQCLAISRTLTESSDTLMAYMIGLRLAEMSGEPKAPLDIERKRINDTLSRMGQSSVDAEQPFSCGASARALQMQSLRAAMGELRVLKAVAEATAAAAKR